MTKDEFIKLITYENRVMMFNLSYPNAIRYCRECFGSTYNISDIFFHLNLKFRLDITPTNENMLWLREHSTGLYALFNKNFWFEKEEDLLAVKLMWS